MRLALLVGAFHLTHVEIDDADSAVRLAHLRGALAFGVPGLHVFAEYVPPAAWIILAEGSRFYL